MQALSAPLPDDVRERLNGLPLEPLVEYVFCRLDLDDGEQWIRFKASNGALRQAEFERGHITNSELEVLARRRVG